MGKKRNSRLLVILGVLLVLVVNFSVVSAMMLMVFLVLVVNLGVVSAMMLMMLLVFNFGVVSAMMLMVLLVLDLSIVPAMVFMVLLVLNLGVVSAMMFMVLLVLNLGVVSAMMLMVLLVLNLGVVSAMMLMVLLMLGRAIRLQKKINRSAAYRLANFIYSVCGCSGGDVPSLRYNACVGELSGAGSKGDEDVEARDSHFSSGSELECRTELEGDELLRIPFIHIPATVKKRKILACHSTTETSCRRSKKDHERRHLEP